MKFRRLFAAALLAACSHANSAAEASNHSLVTRAEGNIQLSSGKDPAKTLLPFSKLKPGDKLQLAPQSNLQLVYLNNGRQESWRGPGQLDIGQNQSSSPQSGFAPEVKQLPPAVLSALSKTPSLMADIRNRTGMVFVRSGSAVDQIREMDTTYAQLRASSSPDDITPELYLLNREYELKLYQDMRRVLDDMVLRQPDNPEVISARNLFLRLLNDSQHRGGKGQ